MSLSKEHQDLMNKLSNSFSKFEKLAASYGESTDELMNYYKTGGYAIDSSKAQEIPAKLKDRRSIFERSQVSKTAF